jgi:ketosteroid isomerase-like protein
MSQRNLEIVRKLFADLEATDLAGALSLFHPDVEWSPTEGSYRGVEGVGAHWIEWMEPWDEHRIEPVELIEAGDDGVIATIHLTARGEHSGMEIDQHFFQVYTVQEGKITRMVEFVDRASALESAGL